MKVDKISEKYNLYKEGASYVVDFGNVKRFEDKSVELQISGVEEAGLLNLEATCGCTIPQKTVVDKNTVKFKVTYTDCVGTFSKVVKVVYNKKQLTTIILKGLCN